MARCVICNTEWFPQSMSSPAEPCDCGACATREEARARREVATDSGSSDDPRFPHDDGDVNDNTGGR